jgi:multidrug resistance protein
MQAAASADLTSPASQDNVRVIFGGLLLVMLLAALDSTIVATALPTIVGEFGGLAHISWVVTAYLLAQTIVTPIYGKLGDLYGRKRVLQFAIVLFLIGSALCGLAQSMSHLIIFRGIQGFGGGGLMVTTQAVVADVVPPRARGRYQGIFGAAFGFASIAGPLVGGYFTTQWTWRWIFYINLPVGIIALVVLAATLPSQSSYARHAVDYAGAALLALTLASVVLVTDLGGTVYPWSSPMMIGLIVLAVAGLIAFIFAERGASEPILPLQLFRARDVWVTSVVGLIVGFALIGSVTYLPVFLQIVKGLSPTESGLRMVPLMTGTPDVNCGGSTRQSHRKVQALSNHRHDYRDDLAPADFEYDGGDKYARSVLVYVAARSWPRLRHAGADHRGSERCRLPRSWRGNFECDPVSFHRRFAGHCAAWLSARNATTRQRAAAHAGQWRPRFD